MSVRLIGLGYSRQMPKVLVTGMSGTGKSTALEVLGRRGHRVVDTDSDEWCRLTTDADGSEDWIWRQDRMSELLDSHHEGALFVAGCRSNQGAFYRQFDHIALLSAPAGVLLRRIAVRSNNPYGKTAVQRDRILRHLAEIEPLLRAAASVEIDASAPLADVVRRLEDLVVNR
jgi:NAD(P)-dependent dehydrogenase (short-subunit alcohol dehydrogenase family)